ncbi:MAG: type II toxin-antitoxin system HicA family toxin [Chloroflexota bacterium]|nr:type II toxin-antitoxin system HicA family toxin [Chloroflexota bacterium]
MTQREKLLRKLRNNPRNVSFETLDTLLKAYGFEMRAGAGSHRTYRRSNCAHVLTIPHATPLDTRYVKLAIQFIDRYAMEPE